MKKIIFASMVFMLMFFAACSSDNQIFPEEIPTVETPSDPAEDENEGEMVVPTEQSASTIVSLEDVAKKGLGGIKLNFTMSGITKIELESVDGYQLAGNLRENLSLVRQLSGRLLFKKLDLSHSHE